MYFLFETQSRRSHSVLFSYTVNRILCTCANEEHVIRPLVQGVNPVHCYPCEVHPLGQQQGATQSFILHQRVLLCKVERGVRELQGAVVAVLPVCAGNTLQHRERGGGRMERRTERDKVSQEGEGVGGGSFLTGAGTGWHG